jgi:membrane-associated phospholipid phosphatase
MEDAYANSDHNFFDRYIGSNCGQVLRNESEPVRTLGPNVFFSLIILAVLGTTLLAQDSVGNESLLPEQTDSKQVNSPEEFSESRLGFSLLKNIALDQKTIWTSPFHLHSDDGTWLFPLATVTALSIATDRSFVHALSSDPQKLNRYRGFSNDGVAALVGVGVGSYIWSYISHDEHQRETGILTGEAAIDSLLTTQALKYSFGRERPTADQGRLDFFKGGNSFPSDHAAAAWSAATVIAHEYPGFLTQTLAYGLATAVSASVVLGKDHSPSDALIGSAMGWLIGRQIYRAHHDPDLGGGTVGDLPGTENRGGERDRQDMGSPFVPLDSWAYSTFERLAALGYVSSAILGLKPWTRMECARLTEEAAESLQEADRPNREAAGLVTRLQQEFGYEGGLLSGGHNLTANLDSLYVRAVSISGPALTNSDHFGQTIAYDFGRPYERGTNGQAGGSFDAALGPLVIYVRAEYQHAPATPSYSDTVRDAIAQADNVPLAEVPSGASATINRPELLDAYAAVNIHNWELEVGNQSLDWSPAVDSMMWSNNSEPVTMVRLVNPEPFSLPGLLRHIGPVRIDQLFGRLEGHPYVPNPFVYGQKISVKPFPFLELGFGRRTTIGGTGSDSPVTLRNLGLSLVGIVRPSINHIPGGSDSEMDWTFYVPKVRHYVVLYGDAYAEDDILPIENPPRNPWHPGIYITRIPGIPKLDFHMEGVSTESPCALIGLGNHGCGGNFGRYTYYKFDYPDLDQSYGYLMGNTVGRDGRSIQSWLTYWFSPRNTLQLTYRHNSVARDFLPGGAAWQDYALENELYLRNGFYLKSELQYENISRYPILFSGSQRNITAILEVGFYPERNSGRQKSNP